MTRDDNGSDSVVDRVYEQLKAMSVSYELKPGERLNEGELAKRAFYILHHKERHVSKAEAALLATMTAAK